MKLFFVMGKSCTTCLHGRLFNQYASKIACDKLSTQFVDFQYKCEYYLWNFVAEAKKL